MSFSIERDVQPLLPKHWEFRRLKEIAEVTPSNVDKLSMDSEQPVLLCNYVDTYKNEKITSKIDFMKATASTSQIERLSLSKGDITITKDSESPWDIAVPAYVSEDIKGLVCGYHLSKIAPNPQRMNGNFLSWALRCSSVNLQFALISQGITRYGLNSSGLSDGRVPCPPLDEQIAIADYLDTETKRIDGLIGEKEKLIALIKEWRNSTIYEAVTKGLNKDVTLKPSGVAWLGAVPKHWVVGPYKVLVKIENGADYKHIEAEDGYPVIGSGGPFAFASEKMYEGESVLLGRKGTVDKPLYVNGPFWTVDTMYWSKINDGCCGRFAYYLATQIPFDLYSTSTALPSMTKTILSGHTVAIPAFEEQVQIARYLDNETRRMDKLLDHIDSEIEILKELRSSTITDAVLGCIDI